MLDGIEQSFVVGSDGFVEMRQKITEKARGMTPCIRPIAASRHDDHAAFAHSLVDKKVALEYGFVRDAPVAELVVFGDIHARKIEHEIGLDLMNDVRKR